MVQIQQKINCQEFNLSILYSKLKISFDYTYNLTCGYWYTITFEL